MDMGDGNTSSLTDGPVRVLLLSDVRLHREGLAGSLNSCDGLAVVGEASDASAALAVTASTSAEVILLDLLTEREAEIAALIDSGLSNKEIAKQLNVEVATVKNHVHHILEKLHVTTRHEVAALLRVSAAPPRPSTSADRARRPPRRV